MWVMGVGAVLGMVCAVVVAKGAITSPSSVGLSVYAAVGCTNTTQMSMGLVVSSCCSGANPFFWVLEHARLRQKSPMYLR